MKFTTLFLLLLNLNLLFGFDALLEYKLKLLDQFKPAKEWVQLKLDDLFAMEFESPDSFIKMGTCLELKDGKFVRTALVLTGKGTTLIKDRLSTFMKEFEEKFKSHLKVWDGNIDPFKKLGPSINKTFNIIESGLSEN